MPAHSQKTIRPSEPRTGRSARHCGRAARVCRRAPGSAMSPLHGHSPWPAPVAGGAAVARLGQLPSSWAPGLESATAVESVRRFQATTGHSARWRQTVSEVLSTAPRTPGTLGAQCHARVTTSRPRYNDAEDDKVLRTPSLGERAAAVSEWHRVRSRVCARMAHVDCMQLTDMQLTGVHGMIVLSVQQKKSITFLLPELGGGKASGA